MIPKNLIIIFMAYLVGSSQIILATEEAGYAYSSFGNRSLKKWNDNKKNPQKRWKLKASSNPPRLPHPLTNNTETPNATAVANQTIYYFQTIAEEIKDQILSACQNEPNMRLVSKELCSMLNTRIYTLKPRTSVRHSMVAFSYFINELPNLKTLNLYSIGVEEKGIQWLAKALTRNTTLKTLYLGENEVDDQNIKWLAKALINNTTLSTLNLYSNDVSDKGIPELTEVLANNRTLTAIDLGYNGICNGGAKELAKALANNTTLRTLNLASNNITEEGAQEFLKALTKNTTLTILNLSPHHRIEGDTRKSINNLLVHNKTLMR